MTDVSFVLEFSDNKGIKRNVYHFKGDNMFEIHGFDKYYFTKDDSIANLVGVLYKLGVTKITKSSPYWIGDLIRASESILQTNLNTLRIYSKLYNTNVSKSVLSTDEFYAICTILNTYDEIGKKYSTPFKTKDGKIKVKNFVEKKDMALSTFLKELSVVLPSISELCNNGFTVNEAKSLARVMDRVGARYAI